MQNCKSDDLCHMLMNSSRLLKWNLTGRLGDVGLTSPQWMVLNDIMVHEDSGDISMSLTPASIAERLNFDRPTVSGIIERLEKQSWVYRVINPEDRRSYIIMLTDKTKELMSELEELSSLTVEQALKGFTEAEISQFNQYLKRVINNLHYKK